MAKKDQGMLATEERLTREHGWEPVENGKIEKWEKGAVVQGVFVKVKDGSLERADGSHAKLLVVRVENGDTRVFGVPAILESMLEAFCPGDGIYIRSLGKVRETAGTKKFGNAAHDFEVKRRRVQMSAV